MALKRKKRKKMIKIKNKRKRYVMYQWGYIKIKKLSNISITIFKDKKLIQITEFSWNLEMNNQ
jgi:hypothetical protein